MKYVRRSTTRQGSFWFFQYSPRQFLDLSTLSKNHLSSMLGKIKKITSNSTGIQCRSVMICRWPVSIDETATYGTNGVSFALVEKKSSAFSLTPGASESLLLFRRRSWCSDISQMTSYNAWLNKVHKRY
jgi:hypothetical protein